MLGIRCYDRSTSIYRAWCISSSPLTLGYDITDDNITERIWPIVGNPDAIRVNQAWAGSPGRMIRNLTAVVNATIAGRGCGGPALSCCKDGARQGICGSQLWVKPIDAKTGAVAV